MDRKEYSNGDVGSTYNHKPTNGASKPSARRAFILVNLVTLGYVFSVANLGSFGVQFVFFRLQLQYNGTYVSNSSSCEVVNNDTQYRILEEIGEKAAEFQIYLSITLGLPALLTCLVYGSLSDRFGRRSLFTLPVAGLLVRACVYAVVSYWELSLYYLFIGHFLDGLSGGFACLLLASFVGFSDITSAGKRRSIVIAIIEATGILSFGTANLILGYMIKSLGYTYPVLLVIGIDLVTLILTIFALPETRPHTSGEKLSCDVFKAGIQRAFSVYTKHGKGSMRCRLILCLIAFFITSITFIGSAGTEILYVKNRPLCWDSVEIGYFVFLKSVCSALAVPLLIRIIQICLGDVGIAVVCGLTKVVSFVLQGIAETDMEMYIAAAVGVPSIGLMAMIRSIMSKSVSPEHLGSMFAGTACAESATTMVGGVLFSAIYKATIHENPGAIFFVMAGLLGVVIILLGAIYRVMRKDRQVQCLVVDEHTPILAPREEDHKTI